MLPERERADGPRRGRRGQPAEVTAYADDAAEARGVADALLAAHGPTRPWSSMAVLYRVNAQSAPFEEALRRAGVPYRVRGAAAFLDRPEVKAVMDDAAQEREGRARARVRRAPHRPRHRRAASCRRTGASTSTRSPRSAASTSPPKAAPVRSPGSRSTCARRCAAATTAGSHDDAVDLLTFHRAKGLEWDTVFVTGLERGLVPISHATGDPGALDEERRLLYVALSRAERHLHLSLGEGAGPRAPGVATAPRARTSAEVERDHRRRGRSPPAPGGNRRGAGEARRAARGGRRPASSRSRTVRSTTRSVTWRRELARAAAVPAYVILDNKTLRGVAERPAPVVRRAARAARASGR